MFIGLDVHKDFIQGATLENASAKVKDSFKFKTSIASIKKYAKTLNKSDTVVLESTTHSVPIAEILKKSGANVIISNPMKTSLITDSKVKTDKIDAEVLARLLASGYIPSVWQPTPEIEIIRKLISFANSVISQRTIIKNRIHSILHRNIVVYNKIPELFNSVGRKFLVKVQLPREERFQLDLELQLLDFTEEKIKTVMKHIAIKVYSDEEAKRLMTISGIDYYTALSLKAAIGDIKRFETSKKLISYFGLNPRIYQSSNSCYTGPITKRGRAHARWVLVQAAHHAAVSPGPLNAFFKRLKRRSARNTAIVAVASKLTRIIWTMLTKKENYYYAHPLRTKEKFAKLRIIATGVRLKSPLKRGMVSKGGREAYLEARRSDHDNAIKEQKTYEEFIENRLPVLNK